MLYFSKRGGKNIWNISNYRCSAKPKQFYARHRKDMELVMQNNYQFQLWSLKTAYTHLVEIDHMNRHLNPILVIIHVNVLLTHVHLWSALLPKDCFGTFLNALNHYGYKLIVYFLEYCIFKFIFFFFCEDALSSPYQMACEK